MQIMITKVVMLNFLLDQFQEQQLKMMWVQLPYLVSAISYLQIC